MGCSTCGGAARQAAASRNRQAAFKAAGSPLGFSAEEPYTLGEPDDRVRRVRVLKRGVGDLTVGQSAYVTGSLVDTFIGSGGLHDITKTKQKKRLFRVNGFTYTDAQEASRVAASLGVQPVEVA